MSASAVCPTCHQPLTEDERRHAFCYRCGKRVVDSRVETALEEKPAAKVEMRVENTTHSNRLAGTPTLVIPRLPLLLLAAALTLLSLYPPFPVVAIFVGSRIFFLSPKVFGLFSAMVLVAAAVCGRYATTRTSRWRCIEIALCAAGMLVATVWGIFVPDVQIATPLVNFVICIMLGQIAGAVGSECAAAAGHPRLARWLDAPKLVLWLALIARVVSVIVGPTELWVLAVAAGGYVIGLLWISCALWRVGLSSAGAARTLTAAGQTRV